GELALGRGRGQVLLRDVVLLGELPDHRPDGLEPGSGLRVLLRPRPRGRRGAGGDREPARGVVLGTHGERALDGGPPVAAVAAGAAAGELRQRDEVTLTARQRTCGGDD